MSGLRGQLVQALRNALDDAAATVSCAVCAWVELYTREEALARGWDVPVDPPGGTQYRRGTCPVCRSKVPSP